MRCCDCSNALAQFLSSALCGLCYGLLWPLPDGRHFNAGILASHGAGTGAGWYSHGSLRSPIAPFSAACDVELCARGGELDFIFILCGKPVGGGRLGRSVIDPILFGGGCLSPHLDLFGSAFWAKASFASGDERGDCRFFLRLFFAGGSNSCLCAYLAGKRCGAGG